MSESRLTDYFPFDSMTTNTGKNVSELCIEQPVMLVFLRHFGCTFCREAMDILSKNQDEIIKKGTKLVFVHMADEKTAEKYFKEFNLEGITHVSDPDCNFYAAMGLVKGNFSQLFGFQNWSRAFNTGVLKGYGWANQIGDGFQMPGVFMIFENEIKESYIHKYASDQVDYLTLAECCKI